MSLSTKRALMIESLEDRKLMAASVDLNGGVLEIEGTSGNDHVQVSTSGNMLNVFVLNGTTFSVQSFNKHYVEEISFVGNNGDDYFRNDADIESRAYGGYGNDTLVGGSHADSLFGDSGNDILRGNYGNDFIRGGSGNDSLLGDVGHDTRYGDCGND